MAHGNVMQHAIVMMINVPIQLDKPTQTPILTTATVGISSCSKGMHI